MFTVINASQFHLIELPKNLIAYCASDQMALSMHSFEQALNLSYWRENHNPFACVVIDQLNQEMMLVRDHIGVEPLYYWFQSNQLIFGHSIPDILKHLAVIPPLLDEQIASLFSTRHRYTDATLYQTIYRVEPGHLIHINAKGRLHKIAFWTLEKEGKELIYSTDDEYVDHFSSLMKEAIQVATQNQTNIAAEFSAGMDSTAVYCTAVAQGIHPKLFMHAADPQNGASFNEPFKWPPNAPTNIQQIVANNFDPMKIFQEYAILFAGAPPNIFDLFAHPLHHAVATSGHPVLLSGFGGDEGISSQAPLRFILPTLIKKGQYSLAWRTLVENTQQQNTLLKSIRQMILFLKYSSSAMHQTIQCLEEIERHIRNIRQPLSKKTNRKTHPYLIERFSTLREAEWFFLQGPFSYDMRMRIEYSSVVSKKMGFQYRYPLLYPKLLEFFISIPFDQKRKNGVGRHLMRRYLARELDSTFFNTYKKKDGLHIFPSTFDAFKQQFQQGVFQEHFRQLPYSQLIDKKVPHMMMLHMISAFMLKNRRINSP